MVLVVPSVRHSGPGGYGGTSFVKPKKKNEGGFQTGFRIRCDYVADDDDDVHVVLFLDGESLCWDLC